MSGLPLEGIRVLDLSWIIAGPTATRFLAMMGAEVIKVGSGRRPDPSTRGAAFQAYNQSKRYASVNVTKPEGLELAKGLVAVSDLAIENFAAGVVERLGLGYDAMTDVNPGIVMISSSGTGHSGPDKDYVAYGSLLQHYTGWNTVSGYPEREPIKGGLWADPWVGMELAMTAVAALNHRAATGQGQYVDFSMAEALSASIPEALLHYQMNDTLKEPSGNRDDRDAPFGAYHCKGDDKWVAIGVTDDAEWKSLCTVIGKPDMADDARLANAGGRRENHDEIDSAIDEWTSAHEDYEAARLLQEAGVTAGPSLDVSRVFDEPQLREGGYFSTHRTSDGEMRDLPGVPWRFEGQPGPYITAAPALGQDNEYVYGELLGISEAEMAALEEQQILY
ncbi:MAG: CoA transferase [Dehalococcoidia bacterium]|jgi:benzylsuccinate CoA-transferase BbsF subunit|nr:CoA transferase [Dehalococcoidia bacterium]MDP7535086.1 CoA transferase [SAR202 cluster bacterium]